MQAPLTVYGSVLSWRSRTCATAPCRCRTTASGAFERLRRHYEALPAEPKSRARALLEKHGCFEPLFRVADPDSRYDDSAVPFRGRKVRYHNARR